MSIDHDFVEENVDAWAIGALDAHEASSLEDHVAGCDDCAVLAEAAREGAASLALAVPILSAPADLKARVMASASILQAVPASKTHASYRSWMMAAAAAVMVVGIGLISWGTIVQRQVNDLQSRNDDLRVSATFQTNQFGTAHTQIMQASAVNANLATTQDAMFEIVAQPDVKGIQLAATNAAPQASAHYVWSRAGDLGALVARDLPALGDDKTYCLWVVYENAWKVGGVFNIDDAGVGRVVIRDLGDDDAANGAFRGFAVTIEPRGVESTQATPHHSDQMVLRSLSN
jgi:anti-sigma-K factor RskA